MNRAKWLLPLVAFFPLLMAPTGGYPTQPLFATVQASGVGAPPCVNPAVNPFVICAPTAQSGLMELSGNGTVPGTSSLAVGQSASGQAVILARGAQSLQIGANAGGQIAISSAGVVTINGASPAPPPIICTTACSGAAVVVGQTITVSVNSNTTRTSTTTATIDGNLQITSLPAGQYGVTYYLAFGASTGAGGWKFNFQDGATSTSVGGVAECPVVNGQFVIQNGNSQFTSCANSGGGWAQGNFNSVGGTLGVFWAQNSSNAAASVLGFNGSNTSYMSVTRYQ